MIDYLIDLSNKTKIPVMNLVKISEQVRYFTKDNKIIQQYMTNTYKGCIYVSKDENTTNYTTNK